MNGLLGSTIRSGVSLAGAVSEPVIETPRLRKDSSVLESAVTQASWREPDHPLGFDRMADASTFRVGRPHVAAEAFGIRYCRLWSGVVRLKEAPQYGHEIGRAHREEKQAAHRLEGAQQSPLPAQHYIAITQRRDRDGREV